MKFRAAVVAAVVAAVMLTVSAVYAGVLWCGEDPVLNIDGHSYNVVVKWPQGNESFISGPINVNVDVPQGIVANVVSESSDTIGSHTTIGVGGHDNGKAKRVWIAAEVKASKQFPIVVDVSKDGSPLLTCRGTTNNEVKCAPIALK